MAHQNGLSAAIAIGVTVYFWRVNIKGIHESSDKALKIMGATTVMGVIMIVWCLVTLAVHPEKHCPRRSPTCRDARPAPRRWMPTGKPIPDAVRQARSTRSGSSAGPRWATRCGPSTHRTG